MSEPCFRDCWRGSQVHAQIQAHAIPMQAASERGSVIMMSLLGSLLGFGTSFLPEVLNYFKASQEHKQRIELLRVQSDLKLKELDMQADISESKGIYEHDRSIDAGSFVNALRGSVRPVITYAFFALFCAVEAVIVVKVLDAGGDWKAAVELLWSGETQGLFAAIMSFWFGNRAVSKYVKR